MTDPHANPTAFRFAEWRLPVGVTTTLLILTFAGVAWMRLEVRRLHAERFERMTGILERQVSQTFAPVQQVLMSLSALVQNTGYNPGEDQWTRHVERAHPYLGQGVVGLGYIRRIERSDAARLEAEMRNRGYPNLVVDVAGAHPQLYVVTNVAPVEPNATILGEDIADGTTRREAAEAAMRRGDFEMSRSIRIVQGEERVPGVLLFWPVFQDGGIPPPAQRESQLVGWVYASLRADLMFQDVTSAIAQQLALDIYQGEEMVPEMQLFETARTVTETPTFTRSIVVDRFGQRWTLFAASTAMFDAVSRTFLAPATLIAGNVVSFLAGWLVWALGSARRRALDLADEMTADLARAERESRKLALVASRTASGVVLADAQWRIEWVNDAFTRMTGYSLEEVKGRRPSDFLVGPETDPVTQRAIEEADRHGVPFIGEVYNYRKDRTGYWIELEMRALFDEFGRRTGNMALQLEIGRRKRVEAELAQRVAEVQRLALVASRTASSVVIMDPAWRIEWVNESFTRLFGYTSAEARGRRPSELLHGPGTAADTMAAIDAADARNELFKGEILNYSKDGRPIWVRLEVQPLFDDGGRKLGYLGLHLDITELKRQAAELFAAKEAAEQANVAKSQFLAMMSHEIRTPMNGVIGMTSLLLETPLTAAQREYAETIRYSGDALLTIIDDILDFSKIESGRLELEVAAFSLRECVERAMEVLSPRAAEKGLELLYEAGEDVPRFVRGDEARLRQVLVNLLSNAVKFTDHGEVVLQVERERLAGDVCSLKFAIADTGIGIPTDALARLFQSFTQVDASTTRRFGGTGLGLAISKRLVELMGGRLWVESTAGVGSTFSFVVRFQLDPARGGQGFDDPAPEFAGKRLLLVEPNAASGRLFTARARRWGLNVEHAPSLEHARVLVLERRMDAAVVNGQIVAESADALGQLRAASPSLPLLLLVPLGRSNLVPLGLPAVYVLNKPARPAALQDALRRAFATTQETVAHPLAELPAVDSVVRDERILLAEDNPVNQRVMLHMLARLRFRADLAADGHEVLSASQRQDYAIIFMDVQMPGLDGLSAARELRRRSGRGTRPWIIAVTANAMRGDREACLAAGMNDYVSKPLKLEELEQAVARFDAQHDR